MPFGAQRKATTIHPLRLCFSLHNQPAPNELTVTMDTNSFHAETATWKERITEEMFIETADEDYVLARWLFINRLHRQFFWSAAQALEKLLKASILINGGSVRDDSHDLGKLYGRVHEFASDLLPTALSCPTEVVAPENMRTSSTTRAFVERIDKHGRTGNRYNLFGIISEFADLYFLDEIVFALRNITHPLDQRDYFEGLADSPRQIILKHPKLRLRRFHERLSNPDRASKALFDAGCDNNFRLAPEGFKHSASLLVSSGTSTWTSFLAKNQLAGNSDVRTWLRENVKLSKIELTELNLGKK